MNTQERIKHILSKPEEEITQEEWEWYDENAQYSYDFNEFLASDESLDSEFARFLNA